ncbi:IS5 family transposase [Amycolatopsis sp. NPDC059020]|uniref:IS5 family transposase n=1 Tax=unclassified Amycolatopsis TaxID=2618356 RepID=UPI00366DA250
MTDRAWAVIKPLLPPQQGGGRRWCEHRQVINAIVWKLRTGAPWRDLPERHGPRKTAHERLRLWTKDGTWGKILDHVIVKDDAVGDVEWVTSIDSSVVRAHQHSAGARKRGCSSDIEALAVDGEELGRSRGGLSTKIHLVVDGRGLPMRFLLTPGQAGDNPLLVPLRPGRGCDDAGPGQRAGESCRRSRAAAGRPGWRENCRPCPPGHDPDPGQYRLELRRVTTLTGGHQQRQWFLALLGGQMQLGRPASPRPAQHGWDTLRDAEYSETGRSS